MVGQRLGKQGADTQRARRPKVLLPLGLDEDLKSLSRCQPCHLKGDCRSRQLMGGQCCWFIHGDDSHLIAIHRLRWPRPGHTEGRLVARSQVQCH